MDVLHWISAENFSEYSLSVDAIFYWNVKLYNRLSHSLVWDLFYVVSFVGWNAYKRKSIFNDANND